MIPPPVLCQVCGARNAPDDELCRRCHHRLLVVSGTAAIPDPDEDDDDEGGGSLDEHLLERISVLEEALRRTAETVRQLVAAVGKQEQTLLVAQTGLSALRELLEAKELVGRGEWSERWESKMDAQLLALDKRERFLASRERIAALHRGERGDAFHRLLDDADEAFGLFDVERAMASLAEAERLDPANPELALFLAEARYAEGDAAAALAGFRRVLAARPDHYEALVYGGVLTHESGDSERAEELLKRAVALYPDEFLPAFSLGSVLAAAGRLPRAAAYLERAVSLDPLPQALYLLGNCLYEMGRVTPAIGRLEAAVRADPGFEEAWYLLGLAYLDRRWSKKALDAFRRAQNLNPRKLSYQDLVRYLTGPGAAPLPPVGGEAARHFARGEERRERGDFERAAESYRRALDLDPENPTLLLSLSLACFSLDRESEIEALARRVLDSAADERVSATAYAALAEVLRGQGKLREGNRLAKRLLAGAGSSFTRAIAWYEMACNLAEMEEDLDEALDCARRALGEAPDELISYPLAALGWVHYKRGELDEAVDALTRAADAGPSPTTLTQLGMALLAAGQADKAKAALARARGLAPRRDGLEQRMMQYLRDSGRLRERVERGRRSS
ncbi:MAG TPA: tetratricopeptide repeat protein [Thermoanaerobaculia bacterium]|nr:tetratricopeptide repeat protein [Thermoanaerobaculia bacterium]